MSAVSELKAEAIDDAPEKLDALSKWHHRMLGRLHEALELGYAQGMLDTKAAVEDAILDACAFAGMSPDTVDVLVNAVRRVRVRGL